MVRFDDYHRTIVGYHGTRLSVALDIVNRRRGFHPSRNRDDWLGHGIYFWEYAPQQAFWWAERRQRLERWDEPIAILGSMIRLGFCFDLLDPFNVLRLRSGYEDYRAARESVNLAVPRSARHRRYLDCAVFEYAYAAIEEQEDRKAIDTARAVYVPTSRAKRIYPGSWISTEAHIQICVRNAACILGTWLHHPNDQESDDAERSPEAAEDQLKHPDRPGHEESPQDDVGGEDPAHGQGGSDHPGGG